MPNLTTTNLAQRMRLFDLIRAGSPSSVGCRYRSWEVTVSGTPDGTKVHLGSFYVGTSRALHAGGVLALLRDVDDLIDMLDARLSGK